MYVFPSGFHDHGSEQRRCHRQGRLKGHVRRLRWVYAHRRHTQQTQIADTHCRHTQQTHTGTPSDLTEPVSPFRGSTSSHISQASFATLLEEGEESSSLQYVHCIRRHELCIEPIPSGFNAEQRAAGTDSRCLLVKDTLLP